jgi:hypothetical protein
MSEAEDKIEEMERALKAERQRLREIGEESDAIDKQIDRSPPPIDHANDGGVI